MNYVKVTLWSLMFVRVVVYFIFSCFYIIVLRVFEETVADRINVSSFVLVILPSHAKHTAEKIMTSIVLRKNYDLFHYLVHKN